jgi:hypothetical protein
MAARIAAGEQAMRSVIFFVLAGLSAGPALAAGQPIQVNSSFNAQIFVAGETEQQIQEQERTLKQSLYQRAIGECELLQASIALSCRITNIGVSTQLNRGHGNPPTFYINANVNMEVTLK